MLTELLQEGGFIQKFDKIESQMKHISIKDLQHLLRREYSVDLQLKRTPQLPSLFVGGAEIEQQDASGVHKMTLEVGRGVDDDTIAGTVQGLTDNIRHELQHVKHMTDKPVIIDKYVHPTPGNKSTGQVRYTYQYMERSAQVLDLCTALAGLDSNPDDFAKMVSSAESDISEEIDEDDHHIEACAQHAGHTAMSHVLSVEKMHDAIDNEKHRHMLVVLHHVTVMALAKTIIGKGRDSGLKNSVASFNKQLRKKFPEARAYFRKHSDDRTQSFKTTKARREELLQTEQQFTSKLAELLSSRR